MSAAWMREDYRTYFPLAECEAKEAEVAHGKGAQTSSIRTTVK